MTISTRRRHGGATAAAVGPVAGHGGAARRAAARAADTFLAWMEHARQRRQLAMLDDRMLDDIGVGSADVLREIDKPFWRG
ncbi:MAG: DUF1127 domain-containing protein [Rhodospirillales bacterium]